MKRLIGINSRYFTSFLPGGLQANQIPQMILIGFSGAVNELVMDQYKKVLGYSTNKYATSQTKYGHNSKRHACIDFDTETDHKVLQFYLTCNPTNF